FIDSINPIDRLIAQMLKAKPKHFPSEEMKWAHDWLYGYATKFSNHTPQPPDPDILAQFLSIAPKADLERLLYQLMAERRRPGDNYVAWFISVACQRIHGIAAKSLAERRAEIKEVRRKEPPANKPTQQEQPSQEFAKDLIEGATAKVRTL